MEGAFHSTQNSGNFSWYINATNLFVLVRLEYSGPALKVVHFDPVISVGGTEMPLFISITALVSFLQEQ